MNNTLRLLPYPDGKTFAFTIVDDTDQSTLESTRPIYDYLHSLGFKTTRTVWVSEPETPATRECDTGDTLSRKEFAAYIRLLQLRGFEIALHNVSSQSNRRPRIAAGIERFRDELGGYPKINVHHEKNQENLYFRFAQHGGPRPSGYRTATFRSLSRWSQRGAGSPAGTNSCCGEVADSKYFWGDLCRERIRYVRTNVFFQELNTLKCAPRTPYTSSETPFVNSWFDSSNGQDVDAFQRILDDRQIARLIADDGCAIVYTHFGKGFVSDSANGYQVHEGFRSRLRAVAGRSDGWYAPAGTILDRLSAFQQVTLVAVPHGMLLANRNPFDLRGVTMRAAPGETYRILGGGEELRADSRGCMVLPFLRAGETVALLRSSEAAEMRWHDERGSAWWHDCRKAAEKLRNRWQRNA